MPPSWRNSGFCPSMETGDRGVIFFDDLVSRRGQPGPCAKKFLGSSTLARGLFSSQKDVHIAQRGRKRIINKSFLKQMLCWGVGNGKVSVFAPGKFFFFF